MKIRYFENIVKYLPVLIACISIGLFGRAHFIKKGADEFKQVIEKFINKFPNVADGYISRAQLEADQDNFISAKSDMEKALKVADKKDGKADSLAALVILKRWANLM